MTRPSEEFDDPIRTVGPDATASFDSGPSNPTEHASSEALGAATAEDDDGAASGSDDAVEPARIDEEAGSSDEEDEDNDPHEVDLVGDDAIAE